MQGEDAVGEQVVAWKDISVEARGRIDYPPIKEVQR